MKYSLPIEALLEKMQVDAQRPVRYFLSAQNHIIDINALIQKSVKISYTKKICLSCGKEVFRSLIQGFCYDCYQTSPMAGRNILHPEESKAHLGIEVRDLAWEKKLELQPHLVYLSITGDIKVGVTRASQAPTRWIDQGAVAAIVVAEVPNRYLAGIAEVALKALFKDKTQWQHMLKMGEIHQNLEQEKKRCMTLLPQEVRKYFSDSDQIHHFLYPLQSPPQQPKSIQLEKLGVFEGKLSGIKGQYLIFENDMVLNVRRHSGLYVSIEAEI